MDCEEATRRQGCESVEASMKVQGMHAMCGHAISEAGTP